MEITILQTPLFARQKKKLKKNQVLGLDLAVEAIRDNPRFGIEKKGDLQGIFVYKFEMVKQECLLAYTWDPKTRLLIAVGSHENFYRELKKYRQSL